MSDPVRSLLAHSPQELEERVVALGGRPFHARIARRELLTNGVLDYAAMTGLPGSLREALAAAVPLLSTREVTRTTARDRTVKLLLALPPRDSREATVETVYIPPHEPTSPPPEGTATPKGATLCVSSQAGCPVGCPFCASGLAGLARNLDAHEIVEQYVAGRAVGPIARSVVMGIGEPLLNFEALRAALEVVHDEMGLGARKVTVSTVGFPDRLARAARSKPRFQLAISLHTPDDDQRDELVPAMAGTPIDAVLAAGDDWFAVTGREVTYEYVLLGGVNDGTGHADRLVRRLAGRRCTVNLIPYNPTEGLPYARPESGAPEAFRARLAESGIVATVRWSRGLDSAAACGQLRLRAGGVTTN
ncbi:MAG: 23S rRNA (adenine(2503)-C(2))-methyltransferase RlmN [bacterium]|nr:23S rRNA (adenine(2503)-C(2))-methyltransferase RlmN [bacterium]